MNNCVAIFDSGNYVFNVCRILEKKGYVFEVIATPCQIAKGGCGYCLKFPEDCTDIVVKTAKDSGFLLRELYRIVPMFNKNRYERLEQQ